MPVKIKYGKRGRPTTRKRILARMLAMMLEREAKIQQNKKNQNEQSID